MTEEKMLEVRSAPDLPRPIVKPNELIERHKEISELIRDGLEDGTDYGIIPGTKKSTLLKPGAERLCIAFGARPKYTLVDKEINHAHENNYQKKIYNNAHPNDRTFRFEDAKSYGLYRYVYKCELIRPDGRILGEGDGSCCTLEGKYIDRPRDCENTVLKMAQKRALIAGCLNAFGLSDRFTQDMEDIVDITPKTKTQPKEKIAIYTGDDKQKKLIVEAAKKLGVEDKTALQEISKACVGTPLDKLDAKVKDYLDNPWVGGLPKELENL